jgi:hypothetical protein
MNTNLLNVLKEIVSRHGGVETLSDVRRVKALLADLAAGEPKPQKNALTACLERGFAAMLQNVPVHERGAAKTKLTERLNREEGLDPALCADTLDMLEAAVFGSVSATAAAVAPAVTAAAKTPSPPEQETERAVAGLQPRSAVPPQYNPNQAVPRQRATRGLRVLKVLSIIVLIWYPLGFIIAVTDGFFLFPAGGVFYCAYPMLHAVVSYVQATKFQKRFMKLMAAIAFLLESIFFLFILDMEPVIEPVFILDMEPVFILSPIYSFLFAIVTLVWVIKKGKEENHVSR